MAAGDPIEPSMGAGPGGSLPGGGGGGGFRGRRNRGQTNAASANLKFDISGLQQFKREIKDLQTEIGKLRQAFKDLAKEPKAFADQLARVNAEMAKLRGQRGSGAFSGGIPGGTASFTGAGGAGGGGGGRMGSAMQSFAGLFGGGAAGAEGGAVMGAGGMSGALGAAGAAMGPLALVGIAKQIGDSVKGAIQGGFDAMNNRWSQGISTGGQFDMNAQRLAISTGRNTSNIAARLRDQVPFYGSAADQGQAVSILASRGAMFGGSGIAGQMGSALSQGVRQFQDIMPGTSAAQGAQMATGLEGNIAGQRRATLNFGAAAWMTSATGVTKDPATYFKGIVQKLQNTRVGDKRGKPFTRDELEAARRPGSTINYDIAQFGWDDQTTQAFWDYAIGQAALDPTGSQTFTGSEAQLNKIGAGVAVSHYEQLQTEAQGKKDLSLYSKNKSDMITQVQKDTEMLDLQRKIESHLSGIYGVMSHVPTGMKGAIGQAAGNLMTGNFIGAGMSLAKGVIGAINPFGDVWNMGDIGDNGLSQVNPDLRGRVQNMMAANPALQVNSGYRNSNQQKRLWESGHPNMAPPGKSRHGWGAAVDIGPRSQLGWLSRNAGKFGLDTGKTQGEPWHVQTAGSMLMGDTGTEADRVAAFSEQTAQASRSVADALAAQYWANQQNGGTAASGTSGSTAPAAPPAPGQSTTSAPGQSSGIASIPDVVKALYSAGFRGDDLIAMAAIPSRETGGTYNVQSTNLNATTKDQSYGLWQINVRKDANYQTAKDFLGSEDWTQLYDINKSAQLAYIMYQRSGNKLTPWGGYKGYSDTYNVDQSAFDSAKAAATELYPGGYGDIGYGGASSTTNASIHAPMNFTNHFQIVTQGSAGVDVNNLVKQIAAKLEPQMRRVQMSRR